MDLSDLSTLIQQLSTKKVPDASNMCFGIVVSENKADISGNLLRGCVLTLEEHGALPENIHIKTDPSLWEGLVRLLFLHFLHGKACSQSLHSVESDQDDLGLYPL